MKTAILIALQLVASGSDAYFTHRNALTPAFHEYNPVARPFVRSAPGQMLYFGGQAALKIAAVHLLKKRGHTKVARGFGLAGIADNASCALYSATH